MHGDQCDLYYEITLKHLLTKTYETHNARRNARSHVAAYKTNELRAMFSLVCAGVTPERQSSVDANQKGYKANELKATRSRTCTGVTPNRQSSIGAYRRTQCIK